MTDAIHHPFAQPPGEGQAIEVAPGILWFRLPLPMALDHVNVFALDDGDGWTVVDTGMMTQKSTAIWEGLIAGPLAGKPIRRLIVTHHHPDHIGLAGWFQGRGVELLTTRTAWLFARMLVLDEQPKTTEVGLMYYRRGGLDAAALAARAERRPFNFSDIVAPMPQGFTRIDDGEILEAGGRRWIVRFGNGHAPDHATLWSLDDHIVLGGDQLLPGISANIGVYPTEPNADPLGEWLDSSRRLEAFATDEQLVLPGHKLPFQGLPFRLVQMVENHISALDRLMDLTATPKTALQCFPALFKREIGPAELELALVESVAHLNYLLKREMVSRSLSAEGAWLWQSR